MDQDWFEMRDIRRRPVAQRAWIPLRASQQVEQIRQYGQAGHRDDFFGLGSVAVPLVNREQGNALTWIDIGLIHNQRSHAFAQSYKPVDVYQRRDEEDLGVELVLVHDFDGLPHSEWHLHQDFVFALGLLREGDVWVCPAEAFEPVVRLHRTPEGRPFLLETRADFLRDYLAARRMALRITWYRLRREIVEDAAHIDWANGSLRQETEIDRFEGRIRAIAEGGLPLGASVQVLRVWRTDVDPEVDVPSFGEEGLDNTDFETATFVHDGPQLQCVEGEVWRNEWLDPAVQSVRVRRDQVPPTVFFITDAEGRRESRETLNDEAAGKYLWFRPDVVPAILSRRGAKLGWYTADTGDVRLTAGYSIHFGINPIGLVNVYAYDIASLPDWQQQMWAGFNVAPNGGVSAELMAAQMRAQPAATIAPEEAFATALLGLDAAFEERCGQPLLRQHASIEEIKKTVHRFRALNQPGLFALAKDMARLTVDSLDLTALNVMVAPPRGERWGTLKSLEKVLATIVAAPEAREIVAPLVGVYELRLGDAHLPSSAISDAFGLVGIASDAAPMRQAIQLLTSATNSLRRAAEKLRAPLDESLTLSGSSLR